jgi:hypothetical protein
MVMMGVGVVEEERKLGKRNAVFHCGYWLICKDEHKST